MFELPAEDDRSSEDLLQKRSNALCLTERELEDYLFNRLSGTTRESVEEHLLLCSSCLDKVEEEEVFAAAVQTAARQIEDERLKRSFEGKRPGVVSRLFGWMKRPWNAGIGLAVTAAALTLWMMPGLRHGPEMEVYLTSERGPATSLGATAEANRNLTLTLDSTGLGAVLLRLELAGTRNELIAETRTAAEAGMVKWELGRSLKQGLYWVRAYEQDGGRLVREYALTVK